MRTNFLLVNIMILMVLINVFSCKTDKFAISTGYLKFNNVKESSLVIENISRGLYFIEIHFKELSIEKLRSEHSESATFEIKISDGKKEIYRSIDVKLDTGMTGTRVFLLGVPKDFKKKSRIDISIESVRYSEGIEEYYNSLKVIIRNLISTPLGLFLA